MNRHHSSILLAAITLGAFALRVIRLDFQPLWWDEGYSVFFATRDFATMLERTAVDIHPPFYYALLQLWMIIAGKSDVALRLLSVLIGVATIPLLYALTAVTLAPHASAGVASEAKQSPNRDGGTLAPHVAVPDVRHSHAGVASPQRPLLATTGQHVAFITALLLALSPFHIYYSQEIRMYGLVTLLSLASLYLFVRLIQVPVSTRASVLVASVYILVTTAALYTQYYAVFTIVSQALVILVVQRAQLAPLFRSSFKLDFRALWKNPLAHWLSAWFVIALLYLPWLIYAGPKLYAYVTSKVAIEKYPPLDPIAFLAQHLAAFSIGHLTAWTLLAWASIVMIALAVLGIVIRPRRQSDKVTRSAASCLPLPLSPALLVTLSLLVPLTLGYLVNLLYPFHPVHGERLLLFAAPAFYLLVALGINVLWNLRAIFGALALIIVAIISALSLSDFYNMPRYPQDDYRPLIAEMQTLTQPKDTFLAIYPWQIGYLETYYAGAPLTIIETPNDAWIKNPAQMQRELGPLSDQNARVWLPALQTQGRILEDALDKYLRERAYSVMDNWYGTTRLEFFAFAANPPLPRAPRNIVFEDDTALGDIGISREPIAAGQDIVQIRFVGETRSPASVQASFRLLDKNGNVWAQSDREIVRDLQRIGLAIPQGTPPGEYDLRVTAYRANDHAALHVKDSTQESASLAMVQIVAPAQPNLAAVPHRAQIDFENGVRLLGYDAPLTWRPGTPTPIALFWQATQSLDKEYVVVLQIQDTRGNIFATTQAVPARGIYPTTRWQPDAIVRDPQTIMLRGDAPNGDYRIVVTLIDPTTGARTSSHEIGTIAAQGRPHYFGAPSPSNKSDVRLDDLARFVGYDVQTDQGAIRLVLYWQALTTSEASYTVFVHLVDANGAIRAQGDQIPGAGAYPTTTWVKGEYLVDEYDIALPPGGNYQLEIGMYNAVTGVRLPVFDASNEPLGDYSTLPTRIR